MTGRALVIRAAGDPEIAGAIIAGIEANRPTATEVEAIQAEMQAAKMREAALGVRVARDRDYFRCKITEARYYYGDNPVHGKAAAAVIGVFGLIIETIDWCYKYLSAWNRR